MKSFRFPSRRAGAIGAVVVVLLGGSAGVATAQAPKEWRLLEADPRMLEYRNKLREGNFDATSRAFLIDAALPQLTLPANRDTIDRVRRRIRESLVADASLPTIVEFVGKLARDDSAAPFGRVNAMLLLGELTGRDRRPWPGATQPLAAALGDTKLPVAVRVAAAEGLAAHVAAAAKDLAPTVGPVLVEVAKTDPATADPVAVNWLVGRALRMLASMGPDAPAETPVAAAAILADDSRPLDVRVRAAAALGGSAIEGRTIDAAAGLRGIRDLAALIVREERTRAQRATAQASMGLAAGGFGDPSMGGYADPTMLGGGLPNLRPPGPGMGTSPGPGLGIPFGGSPEGYAMSPTGMPAMTTSPVDESVQLAFKRAAWRLATLADALEAEGGRRGLVLVAGPLQGDAKQMATVLRGAAMEIDAAPSKISIDKAFETIVGSKPTIKPADGAPAGAPDNSAPQATGTPAAPRQPAAEGNPFAQ